MRVFPQSARVFDPGEVLGVGIRHMDPPYEQQLHIGLIYHIDDSGPRFCHLEWHHQLRDELLPPTYLWGPCGLDFVNKPIMAAYVSLLRKNSKSIPYSIEFNDQGIYFDDEGKYIVHPVGQGLTCATFILAVFSRMGFPLLDIDTWQHRQDDVDWQQRILTVLVNYATQEHISAARQNIGSLRFRPEEVAAGIISEDHPLDFPTAQNVAAEILQDIYGA